MSNVYVPIGAGPVATAVGSSINVTTSAAAGSLGILFTYEVFGSDPTPAVTGWRKLSLGNNANQVALYGRYLTGSDTAAVAWGTALSSYGWIQAYSFTGTPIPLASIVVGTNDHANASSTNAIEVSQSAILPPQDNCLCIAAGARNKTSTTNGATFGPFSGGSFTTRQQFIDAGTTSRSAGIYADWIQTSAATVLANNTATLSVADSGLPYEGTFIVLAPPTAIAPPPPVTGIPIYRKRFRPVQTTYYPR